MRGFASILSLAVVAAIAGCDLHNEARVPVAQPAAAANFTVPSNVATAGEITPFPLLSGQPGGGGAARGSLPVFGGLGLAPIHPMEDLDDVQVLPDESQPAAAGQVASDSATTASQPVAADTLPGEQPQVMGTTVPSDTQPITRIVAEDAATDVPVVPTYVYAPDYTQPCIPQTVIVEAAPLVVVQPEYIPYPVFEPFFVSISRRQFAIDCGIVVHDRHATRSHPAVLINQPVHSPLVIPPSGGGSGHQVLAVTVAPIKAVSQATVPVKAVALGKSTDMPRPAGKLQMPAVQKTVSPALASPPVVASKAAAGSGGGANTEISHRAEIVTKLQKVSKTESDSTPIVVTPPAKSLENARVATREEMPRATPPLILHSAPVSAPPVIHAAPVAVHDAAPVIRPVPVIKVQSPTPVATPSGNGSGSSGSSGRSAVIGRGGRMP